MTPQLGQLWSFLAPLHQEIFGLAFTLAATFVVWLFRPQVKLIFGRANNSLNHVTLSNPENEESPNSLEVYVEKFFLQNTGKKTATSVEFVLSDFPTDVRIWQPRDAEFKNVDKGGCLISIPQIAPSELVTIDCVYLNKRAAFITSVKCAEAMGREVAFQTNRRFPNWINVFAGILMLFGVAFFMQAVFSLILE